MKSHPYAEIYRMLSGDELQKLAEDIKAKGQLLPITSYEGQILDGRNRYRACEIAGINPRIEEYTGNDPIGLIASLNDHRRHDDPTERACVGERMASLKVGNPTFSPISPDGPIGKPAITLARAAELTGTSKSQIKRVRKAKRDGIPVIVDMLESGEITPSVAEAVSSLTNDDQAKAASGGVAGVNAAAKKLKEAKKTIKPDRAQPAATDADEPTAEDDSPMPEAGVAMVYARTALDALNKIPKRDPSRKQAISMISDWIKNNTKYHNHKTP